MDDRLTNKNSVIMFHSPSATDKGNLNVNIYESVLRLQGAQQALSDTSDCEFQRALKVDPVDDSPFRFFGVSIERKKRLTINESVK